MVIAKNDAIIPQLHEQQIRTLGCPISMQHQPTTQRPERFEALRMFKYKSHGYLEKWTLQRILPVWFQCLAIEGTQDCTQTLIAPSAVQHQAGQCTSQHGGSPEVLGTILTTPVLNWTSSATPSYRQAAGSAGPGDS